MHNFCNIRISSINHKWPRIVATQMDHRRHKENRQHFRLMRRDLSATFGTTQPWMNLYISLQGLILGEADSVERISLVMKWCEKILCLFEYKIHLLSLYTLDDMPLPTILQHWFTVLSVSSCLHSIPNMIRLSTWDSWCFLQVLSLAPEEIRQKGAREAPEGDPRGLHNYPPKGLSEKVQQDL